VEEELDLPGWTGKAQDLCGPGRKRRIREMRDHAGSKYFNVTPVMIVFGYVALRYWYVMAGGLLCGVCVVTYRF
jgi:hypothetical protein